MSFRVNEIARESDKIRDPKDERRFLKEAVDALTNGRKVPAHPLTPLKGGGLRRPPTARSKSSDTRIVPNGQSGALSDDENLDYLTIDRAVRELERSDKPGGLERNKELTEKLVRDVSVPRAVGADSHKR